MSKENQTPEPKKTSMYKISNPELQKELDKNVRFYDELKAKLVKGEISRAEFTRELTSIEVDGKKVYPDEILRQLKNAQPERPQ